MEFPPQCGRFIDLAKRQCAPPRMGLQNQGLGIESAKTVAKLLAYTFKGKYRHLDLSCNKFGDYGAGALAWLLERDASLTSLDLRSIGLGGEGGELLFHALRNNRSLTAVDLSTEPGINRNKMGVRGAASFAAALEVPPFCNSAPTLPP